MGQAGPAPLALLNLFLFQCNRGLCIQNEMLTFAGALEKTRAFSIFLLTTMSDFYESL